MQNAKHRGRRFLLTVLIAMLVGWGFSLIAVRGTFAPSRSLSQAGGTPIGVGAAGHRIAGRLYLSGTPAPAFPLVVVLHGDAPFVKPGYHYFFASNLAGAVPGMRVAALLRPGYADPYGAKSDGDRGFAVGENYTPEVVADVAAAIQALQVLWSAPAVILVGHSGGAVIAADVAALYPGLVQHVFLVGCPCSVPAFRRHMLQAQWNPLWLLPVHSLSPLDTLGRMRKGTIVTAISGTNDGIALPQYARAYIAEANARGISASMILLPGEGHEILNEPATAEAVAKAARSER